MSNNLTKTIYDEMRGEFVGTFVLVFFGVGSVVVAVATGGYNLWGLSMMWAIAVMLGIYASGQITGAHLNPAVTISLATYTDFPWKKVVPYIIAQTLAAFAAVVIIHIAFSGIIGHFEIINDLVRGEYGSQLSAMVYATYAPNPAFWGTTAEALPIVSHLTWFLSEAIITAVLLFGIYFLVDPNNKIKPSIAPIMIGLLVGALVAYEAPVSQAALNPARDIGPRIFLWLAGWGKIAFPGPTGGWWIPSVSTIVGGLIGGAFYHGLYKNVFKKTEPTT